MSRQTSKNRWVNGKRTLCWEGNHSEFSGGMEGGWAIELGFFTIKEAGEFIKYRDSDRVMRVNAYSVGEKDCLVASFLEHGDLEH